MRKKQEKIKISIEIPLSDYIFLKETFSKAPPYALKNTLTYEESMRLAIIMPVLRKAVVYGEVVRVDPIDADSSEIFLGLKGEILA